MKLAKYFSIFSQILADERPNVIILIGDDFGAGDFRVNQAASKVPTPNIDRLANEGVNFKDAHSGSSRCSPSRYMLMTGRYSMIPGKNRSILPGKEPHLGQMFHKAGYKTGIFGKSQPLKTSTINTDQTEAERAERRKMAWQWKVDNYNNPREFLKSDGVEKKLFMDVGNYTIVDSEVEKYDYDYSFTVGNPCCQPNGYFENGQQIEEFSEWAIQREYPEGAEPEDASDNILGAYVGAPYFEEETFAEKILMGNFPRSMVAQPNYDSRTLDETVSHKLLDFIRDQEGSDQPWFTYWGMRVGHRPFNTPERYRNTTEAGVLGEMIAEADDYVGNIFQTLEETGQANNTLIILMSDNGADGSNKLNQDLFGHTQNAIDLRGEPVILRGQKNWNWEGGHRLPFMWWLPSQFAPQTVEHQVVSYVDVYRTLTDLAGYEAPCNEAPDSRSLLPFMKGESDTIEGHGWILTHAPFGGTVAFRVGKWKLIPDIEEFYNIRLDPAEQNNLWEDPSAQAKIAEMQVWLGYVLKNISDREARQNNGELNVC